jgi:hypothetical protein
MSLSIGIVGLPNVGKSTLFKTLTKKEVDIANYPFTTIEPNVAIVSVPDENLEKLSQIFKPEKVTPATIEFIDIAGLVKEAHLGKGLGNQFLAKIRETNLLVEVVRVFEDKNVPHVENSIDPARDIGIIKEELKQAGIEKPIIFVFNVKPESDFQLPENYSGLAIPLKDELEISELSVQEKEELEIKTSGLIDDLIKTCYRALGLITFYTIKGGKETRATKIEKGTGILDAAEKIHSDFKEKFIKAEVVNYQDLLEAGGWYQAREKGLIRTEGKEYVVQDGDVIEIKHG